MNKALFKKELKRKKIKQKDLAVILGLTEQSITNKIGEVRSEFTSSEIRKLKTELELTDEQVIAIFFKD